MEALHEDSVLHEEGIAGRAVVLWDGAGGDLHEDGVLHERGSGYGGVVVWRLRGGLARGWCCTRGVWQEGCGDYGGVAGRFCTRMVLHKGPCTRVV